MTSFLRDQNQFRIFLSLGAVALLTLFWETWIGSVGPTVLAISVLLFWLVTGLMLRRGFRDLQGEISLIENESSSKLELFLGLLILGLALYHASFFLFEASGTIWIKNPNLNGDLPFHWHQMRFLQRGPPFWPENPQYLGDHLRYAFGVNWLSALLLRVGVPFGAVLILPLMLSIVAVWNQLWKWAGLWGVVAFFGSGGGWWLSLQIWPDLWAPGDQIAWKNLFLALLITQRGFWFALPAGLLCLRFLLEMHRYPWLAEPSRWRILFALWACLPFFHLHSFLILSLFAVLLIATGPLRKHWRAILEQALFWAWIPLIFIWQSVNWTNSQKSLRWVSNWMSETQDLWSSLGQNFGPWLLLVLLLLMASLLKVRFRGQKLVPDFDQQPILIWAGLWLLFSHLLLAPWAWDQSKIILWIYLGLSMALLPPLARALPSFLRFVLMLLIFLPGLFQFLGGSPSRLASQKLWTVEDQMAVQSLVSSLPVEERVLVAPSPHHPVLATGQPLVAGYLGHLWSHGLEIAGLEAELRQLVTGSESRFDPRYLIWGPIERSWFGISEPVATRKGEPRWVKIRSSGEWALYSRAD